MLERARRLELRERAHAGEAHCVADFEGGHRTVEGRGESLRTALLRAFVESRFGGAVDDVLRQAQSLVGVRAEPIGEQTAIASVEDTPTPDGRIGDIQSAPR